MKKTIIKYYVGIGAEIRMPKGAEVFSVGVQNEGIWIWAIVTETNPIVKRDIGVYGTGEYLPEKTGVFLGTVFLSGGVFVFHVFDNGEIS